MLAWLAAARLDLTTAGLVVGTSAGSVVGAQILSGVSLEDLYAAQPGRQQRGRARVGHAALSARTVSESERLAVVAKRLPSPDWPERRLLITAADAESGEARTFDRAAGVRLVDAMAASWPTCKETA